MLIYFAFFVLSRATVIQLLLTVTYHVYRSLRWHHDVLLLHHVVIVLKLLREGIMRIYIGEELLQLFPPTRALANDRLESGGNFRGGLF